MRSTSRYHEIVENLRVKTVVSLANLLRGIEDVVENIVIELGLETIGFRVEGLGRDGIDMVEVYIDSDTQCSKDMQISSVLVKVVCGRIKSNVDEVYKYAVLNMVSTAIDILKPFMNRDEEYMVVLLENGYAVVLQGTLGKVVVPRIPGTLFTCHTHPKSIRAIFSKEDLKSLLDLLSNKGFGSCVLSQTSCLTVYRRGLFKVDDYFKLFQLLKEIEYLDLNTLKSLNLETVDGFEIAI